MHGPTKQAIEITYVNPATLEVEGRLPDGGKVSVEVNGDVVFRWPIVGERWTIQRDPQFQTSWNLTTRIQDRTIRTQNDAPAIAYDELFGLDDMLPGNVRIDGATIYDSQGRRLYLADEILPVLDRITALEIPIVTVLPTTGNYAGREVYLRTTAMATAYLRWRMIHNGTNWEKVSGGEFLAGPLGDVTTASPTPVALTGGPSLSVTQTGIYTLTLNVALLSNASPSGYAIASIFADSTDTGVSVVFVFQGTSAGQQITLYRVGEAVLTAGQTLTTKVSCANSSSNRFLSARISMSPMVLT